MEKLLNNYYFKLNFLKVFLYLFKVYERHIDRHYLMFSNNSINKQMLVNEIRALKVIRTLDKYGNN